MITLTNKQQILSKNLIRFFVLAFISIVVLLPFIWMVSVSFDGEANRRLPFPPKFIPEVLSFFNYKLAVEDGMLFAGYRNSMIVTTSAVFVVVAVSLMGGYAFSKGQFRGKKILFVVLLSTMMIPLETRIVPMYKMFKSIGLYDNFLALILPTLVQPFFIVLMKQYMDKLPNSLREASKIDGAKEFRIFSTIFAPLTGPITATTVILSFMWTWNDYLWPLIAITTSEKYTMPLYLSLVALEREAANTYVGRTMAIACLSIIPIVAVFLLLQKYIIQSVALSGIKGE